MSQLLSLTPPERLAPAPFTGRVVVRLADIVQARLLDYYATASAPYIGDVERLAAIGGTPRLRELVQSLGATAHPLVRTEHVAVVQRLETTAARSDFPPLRSLLSYVVVDTRAAVERTSLQAVLALFAEQNLVPEVDFVVPELRLVVAGAVTPDDALVGSQGYLEGNDSSPVKPNQGINVHNPLVWGQFDGSNVGFIDIELGWAPHHVDLPLIAVFWPAAPVQFEWDHGTMALGIVVGKDSPPVGGLAEGIVGIAPAATLIGCASYVAPGNPWDLSGAMIEASTKLVAGDVLLLEVQTDVYREIQKDGLPVEVDPAWLDTIRLLVGNDIVVVESAGNGENGPFDLDLPPIIWMQPGNPPPPHDLKKSGSASFVDSGAIMVSGCDSTVIMGAHLRAHNFGSRIDCYAWSDSVRTTFWMPGSAAFNVYDDFTGTSAASAIIAGAATLVQHMAKTKLGTYLQPAQLRALLGSWSLGTPVVNVAGGAQIGVMPDLVKVGQQLGALPDIYVRDSLTDFGDIPSPMVSQSPDIIVRSTQSANPEADFGRTSTFSDAYVANHLVVAGAANYVYVRMLNRSPQPALATNATVYWAPLSPLILPDDWHLIGVSATVQLPGVANPGDPHSMAVVELPPWTPAASELPASGHACFIAVLHDPLDPTPAFFATPPAAAPTTDSEILQALGRYNNAAFRNFNVLAMSMASADVASPGTGGEWANLDPVRFFVRGLESRGLITGFVLEHNAPRGVEFQVLLPGEFTEQVEFVNRRLERDGRGRAMIRLDSTRRRADYPDVPIRAGARHECTLRTRIPRDLPRRTWRLVIRQHVAGRWVGALTFQFGGERQ